MSWRDEYKRACVKVAAPDFELQDGDEIEVDAIYDEGYYYSSYTSQDPRFEFRVYVRRSTGFGRYPEYPVDVTYYGEEVAKFQMELLADD